MITIILIILFIISAAVIGWLLWKKWPQIRLVDPMSSKTGQAKQLKYQIIRQRVERASGKQVDRLQSQVFKPLGGGMQNAIRRIAGKLTAVERRYQEKQKIGATETLTPEMAKAMIEEGKKFMEQELWDRAEKRFIEVISADPKNTAAYERLARLYFLKREYDLAKETLLFLQKLSPDDPSVIAALGEVAEKLGETKEAHKHYKKAHTLSPKNPKYLDFFIESCIVNQCKQEALDALDMLHQVNPENQKIPQFAEQIAELPEVDTTEEEKPVVKEKKTRKKKAKQK